MEVPVAVRAEWRRQLHADLCNLSDPAGTSGDDNGVRSGTRVTEQSDLYVSEAVRQEEMGRLRNYLSDRQYRLDGILHGCNRMDYLLLRKVYYRSESGFWICEYDYESDSERDISSDYGFDRFRYPEFSSSGRSGANHEVYDVRTDCADAGAGCSQPDAEGRRRGYGVLSDS